MNSAASLTGINQVLFNIKYLRSSFKTNKACIQHDASLWQSYKQELKQCQLQLSQLTVTTEPLDRELAWRATTKIAKLSRELQAAAPFYVKQSCLDGLSSQMALLHLADRFRKHQTLEALEEMDELERKDPACAQQVYRQLSQNNGYPEEIGKRAFHNRQGHSCLNSEKAAALMDAVIEIENRLSIIKGVFEEANHPIIDACVLMSAFEADHPYLARMLFGKVWQVYGCPGIAGHSELAHPDFGRVAFYDRHPSPKFSFDRARMAEAVQNLLKEMPGYRNERKHWQEEHAMRLKRRWQEVITETLQILQRGAYDSTSGKRFTIKDEIDFAVRNSRLYSDGGVLERKAPRFVSETHLEVRAVSCIEAAYDLCVHGANPLVLNLGCKRGEETKEGELLRCTSAAAALDAKMEAKKEMRRGACLYTPQVTLFRMGEERDYQLYEQPAQIALATVTDSDRQLQLREIIRTILRIAYENGHDTLVLGTFGEGTPFHQSAQLYMDILQKEYPGCFKKVVFALKEEGMPSENFRAFARVIQGYRGSVYTADGEPFRE